MKFCLVRITVMYRLLYSTGFLRRWPKLRRRVIVSRRAYDKIYWYLREFKDEFVDEIIRAPIERKRRAKELEGQVDIPIYYNMYLWVKCIPEGFRLYLKGIKEEWQRWENFRDSSILGYKRISSEIKEIHEEEQVKYKKFFLIALRMYRDALRGFLKGYNESIDEKPFPSDKIIEEERKRSDPSMVQSQEEGTNEKR